LIRLPSSATFRHSVAVPRSSTIALQSGAREYRADRHAALRRPHDDAQRLAALRIVLIVVGLIAVFAIWPLITLRLSGWTWHSGHSDHPLMIVGIYATLGVFLLMASRDPMKHLSLIWFTVWSSVVHGAMMAVQSCGVEMDGQAISAIYSAMCPRCSLSRRRWLSSRRAATERARSHA
jgi:hypothetical protein